MKEASLRETETGLVPEGAGWFVLNLRDASWSTFEGGGTWVDFGAEGVRQQIGVGVHVLMPGDAPGRYHAESDQEGFLVLAGECVLIVEGEERRLRQWDYFHCPPGTAHITVGASEEPCAIFMLGARTPGKLLEYIAGPGGRAARRGGQGARGPVARGLRGPGPHADERQGSLARNLTTSSTSALVVAGRAERRDLRPAAVELPGALDPAVDHQRGGEDAAARHDRARVLRVDDQRAVAVAEQDRVEHRQQADVRRRRLEPARQIQAVRPSTSTSSRSSSA